MPTASVSRGVQCAEKVSPVVPTWNAEARFPARPALLRKIELDSLLALPDESAQSRSRMGGDFRFSPVLR
jgi:hypothetical protein